MRFRARDNRGERGSFAGWKPALQMDRSLRWTVVCGWPDPGPIVESGPLRIFCNVPDDSCERFAVSDKVIEILALPKMAAAAQHEVCRVRGVGFPGVKNRRKRA